MSSNSGSQNLGAGRRQDGGGSVRRAREMLEAGVRQDNAGQNATQSNARPTASQSARQVSKPTASLSQGTNPSVPPPLRPKKANRDSSKSDDANEGEISIGFQIDRDPRGPVPILPIQGLPVPKYTGPPPTSRRGPSSLYSRGPFVSPIPEESPDMRKGNKGSFASSAVIPSSWGSGPPASDILAFYDSGGDSDDDRADKTPVRQASLGKRGKPSLRTINKTPPGGAAEVSSTSSQSVNDEKNDVRDRGLGLTVAEALKHRDSSETDSTDSDSIDLEKRRIAIEGELQRKNGGLATAGPGMSSKKRNARRPPTLDLGAVRDAEARGSLTSLPDLIRRATKVASNLEHGRTASRLGILDMFDSGKEPKRPQPARGRSSASLSDILASFPPPRTGTPDDGARSSWPFPLVGTTEKSKLRNMQTGGDDTEEAAGGKKRNGRRCCGLSLPVFILLCIVALCIIAAAVVIPIVLVVLPRTRNHTTTSATTNTTTTCGQTLPCMNGGVSISTGDTCSCVCVNGFSGAQCGNATDGSCTTTEVSQAANATIGTSLVGLLSASESNFSIPLNGTELVSLFNADNVTCTVQNDLVFFDVPSSKHRRASPVAVQEPRITDAPIFELVKKTSVEYSSILAPPPILSVPSDSASATSTTKAAEPLKGASTTTATSATATPSATSIATSRATIEHAFDFARVAVLFIFEQTKNMSAASTARSDISSFLISSMTNQDTSMSMNMTGGMPQNFVLDFAKFTITLPNGTVVGGGNGTAS